jgi:regulator of replication initiation timing
MIPFVSRRSYEYMIDINAARIEDLKKTLESEREHNHYLTSELLKLKRDGFNQPLEQPAYESSM